jgi:hypothetical protein
MKQTLALAFLCLAMIGSIQAQTAPIAPTPTAPTSSPSTSSPTFSLNASIISLSANGATTPATVIGETYAATSNFLLREDNIIGPGANLNAYLGGAQYNLTGLSKLLKNTNLNNKNVQFYALALAGANHVTDPETKLTRQHFSFEAGGGVNYDPTGSGKFTVNLVEVKYLKAPGFNNNAVSVSGGVVLGLF